MRMTNTAAALAPAVTMGAGAAWAVPEVSNVQMAQRANSRVVDITYDLAGEAAIVTLGIETNGVAIPDSAVTRLSGDVSVVIQPGTGRHIVWNAAVDWPANDAVTPGSFMGRLRTKTGLAGFDLPTDAQWEYACRAGTSGALSDGTVNLTNTASDARLDLLGRYLYDGGKVWNGTAWVDPATDCTTANATAEVGSYLPNAWGLYDMHGNVWEWCLDWYAGNLGTDAVSDPEGADSGSIRVRRGGGWSSSASLCRSAYRRDNGPSRRSSDVGFRLVRTLP